MSSSSSSSSSSTGISLVSILTVLFVCLKVFGYVQWSWWIVFTPLIVSVSLAFLILGVLFLFEWKVS